MRRAPATHIDAAEASPKTCAIEIAGAQDEALGPDGAPVPKRTRRRPGDPPAPPKPRRAREARAGTLPAGAAAGGGRPRGAPGAAAAAAAASAQRRLAAAAAGAAALPPPRRALLTAMQWRSSVGRAGLHALAAAAPCAPRTRCHPLSSTDACDGLALFQASGLFLLSAVRDSVTPSCAGPSLLAEAAPPVTRACGRAPGAAPTPAVAAAAELTLALLVAAEAAAAGRRAPLDADAYTALVRPACVLAPLASLKPAVIRGWTV